MQQRARRLVTLSGLPALTERLQLLQSRRWSPSYRTPLQSSCGTVSGVATGFFAAQSRVASQGYRFGSLRARRLGQNVADPVSMKINKTSSGVSAQNSWQATEQIHTARKFQSEPASIRPRCTPKTTKINMTTMMTSGISPCP